MANIQDQAIREKQSEKLGNEAINNGINRARSGMDAVFRDAGARLDAESRMEKALKKIRQWLYDDERLREMLVTDQKIILLCGLVMAALPIEGAPDLEASDFTGKDDGLAVIERIGVLLRTRKCPEDETVPIMDLLRPVFSMDGLRKPVDGESAIRRLFKQVKGGLLPHPDACFNLDLGGMILNHMSDWERIGKDEANDVVLTPWPIGHFMAALCRAGMDTIALDCTMGTGGLLLAAMDAMGEDARKRIKNDRELRGKQREIREKRVIGFESRGKIHLLAILNALLRGDWPEKLMHGDGLGGEMEHDADVFLLNPPYSAPGKGLVFVQKAMGSMRHGSAAILIQECAGSGKGGEYAKRILERNTLLASIRMPARLFAGKANVQTAIYLFKVNRPHALSDKVKFLDFSNDGYGRQARKKSTKAANLRDADHASERYAEALALILGQEPKTEYYTKENGLYFEDAISLSGDDWTFQQHKKIDLVPTEEDFKRVVADYLAWKVGAMMRGELTA